MKKEKINLTISQYCELRPCTKQYVSKLIKQKKIKFSVDPFSGMYKIHEYPPVLESAND
jgi:hypothetical protein